jgi:hypothetical protein
VTWPAMLRLLIEYMAWCLPMYGPLAQQSGRDVADRRSRGPIGRRVCQRAGGGRTSSSPNSLSRATACQRWSMAAMGVSCQDAPHRRRSTGELSGAQLVFSSVRRRAYADISDPQEGFGGEKSQFGQLSVQTRPQDIERPFSVRATYWAKGAVESVSSCQPPSNESRRTALYVRVLTFAPAADSTLGPNLRLRHGRSRPSETRITDA